MAEKKPRGAQDRAHRSLDTGPVQRAIHTTMSSGEALSVGIVHLVTSTLVAAVSGVQDVGKEVGATAVAAVRGSIRAANEIGGDLVGVAGRTVKATMGAAGEIAYGRRPLAKTEPRKMRSVPAGTAKRRTA